MKKNPWELPAQSPEDYFFVEAERGREFIVRLPDGADPLKAISKFASDHGIRFGKVHAAYMGAFKPAKYLAWAPDARDPKNWHHEEVATVENLSMLLACAGMIGVKKNYRGEEESFVALHFVSGGAWDTATFGGHLFEGTKIAGVMAFYITEIVGIDVIPPTQEEGTDQDGFPENWYRQV